MKYMYKVMRKGTMEIGEVLTENIKKATNLALHPVDTEDVVFTSGIVMIEAINDEAHIVYTRNSTYVLTPDNTPS